MSFWGLRLQSLTARHRAVLAASAAGRGPQLYDLVAAQGAAVGLRANGFHGTVEMVSDGSAVIGFMSGEDSSLSLNVQGMNFAHDLRTEVTETLRGSASVVWRLVPRRENLADAAIRQLRATPPKPQRQNRSAEGARPDDRRVRRRWFRR